MASYFTGKRAAEKAEEAAAAETAPPATPDLTQVLHPQPVPGIRMRAPEIVSAPGQVIIGYKVIKPESGGKMAAGVAGGTALGVFSVLIFPCCLPCAVAACVVPALQSRMDQLPVYGWPGDAPVLTQGEAVPAPGQPFAAEAAATGVTVAPAEVPLAEVPPGYAPQVAANGLDVAPPAGYAPQPAANALAVAPPAGYAPQPAANGAAVAPAEAAPSSPVMAPAAPGPLAASAHALSASHMMV
ncbi:hypothetical protein C2E21_6158 [Chlorella sorokiniana]|uniref:Uncharacterized protein n=1 Tax=Chlorella sorokiniana TaxID=3076 RepID=A0A2P6TL41_CHLSO|nr:hypothetical protein C2E21_6158 [Chlorella sorokiniana]|eukprot:PRW44994.1 hypothetical protein C2E21_6158 [Chlorella sorokiniana]